MAVIKAVSSKVSVGQALDYVMKQEKTESKLITGLGCEAETVKEEMQQLKNYGENWTAGHTSILFKVIIRASRSHRSKLTGMQSSLRMLPRHGTAMKSL